MAIHAHSTTVPAVHRSLLQAFADAAPVPTPALTAETVDMLDAVEPDTIDDIRRDLDALIAGAAARPELPPEPLLSAARGKAVTITFDRFRDAPRIYEAAASGFVVETGKTYDFDVFADDEVRLWRNNRKVTAAHKATLRADVLAAYKQATATEPDTADRARTLHLRRQLEAAAEHGAAMLAALGMPRLVGPDFRCVDIGTAGDALDIAIATLDALDGDADFEDGDEAEPWLGWVSHPHGAVSAGGTLDLEEDRADNEPSLASPERHPSPPEWVVPWTYTDRSANCRQTNWAAGARDDREEAEEDGPIDDDERCGSEHDGREASLGWAANVSQVLLHGASPGSDEEEHTAPERAGRGFVRCGPDDSEEDDPAEHDDHHGSEDDPRPWRFERPDAVYRAAQIAEVARHGC